MATRCYSEESNWLAMQGAVRNFVLVIGAFAAASYAATWFTQNASADQVRTVMRDIWPLQGMLVTAVLALIYRLSADTSSVKGMKASQRRKLDEMVTRKSWRLWALSACIVLPVLLARVDDKFSSPLLGQGALWLSMMLATSSFMLCFYLPKMWNELRRFVTSLVVQAEEDERVKDELERLRGKHKDGSIT